MSDLLPTWVAEILRCPVGRHRLTEARDAAGQSVLECTADCGGQGRRLQFPIRDGIPVLLADDATPVQR